MNQNIDNAASPFKKNAVEDESVKRTLAAITSELLFVLLPFLVLLLVTAHKEGSIQSLIFAPEWAFAATILFGQTTVKMVSGFLEGKGETIHEILGFAITAAIVLGVVPSMVVLTMLLLTPNPSFWLGLGQVILFIFSVIMFVVLGGAAQAHATEARLSK